MRPSFSTPDHLTPSADLTSAAPVPRLRRWIALGSVVLTVVAGGASSTPAHAESTHSAKAGTSGSIVFVKDHDVWIARGNGKHARRLTHNGTKRSPYVSPSEAPNGTIAVGHGKLLVRLNQHGRVLSKFDPPALRNSAGEWMDGAVNDVALSPNGKTIAWSFVRYTCPIGADCMVRFATGYTSASRYHRAAPSTFYRAASWVSNTRTLQTGGSGSQVMIDDLRSAPRHWFDDSDINFPSTDLADGDLSADGRWLAEIRGYAASSTIAWYRVKGNARRGAPPAVPVYTCVTNPARGHAGPTWSPDSSAVAWTSRDGVWIQRDAAHCGASAPARLAIPGGSMPDWSPAVLH